MKEEENQGGIMKMTTQVRKWGNSLGHSDPQPYCRDVVHQARLRIGNESGKPRD